MKEILGIGIDILDLERFNKAITRHPGLIEKLFTQDEITYCQSCPNPIRRFGARFALKEAVMKSLSLSMFELKFKNIESAKSTSGAPSVTIAPNYSIKGIRFPDLEFKVSMSHEKNTAIAVALALTNK
jgi:holo-[acyl-carrier protein] synthase